MSVPPRRLFASPMAETVTSMVCPCFANGGSSACTTTGATSFILGLRLSEILMPKLFSMVLKVCSEKALFFSPVPGRPTTRP